MKQELFDKLMQSTGEALQHARGKLDLRTTVLAPRPKPMTASQIRAVRMRLNASQALFAACLNVSPKAVQAWEARRRRPAGAALRLLYLADSHPSTFIQTMQVTGLRQAARQRSR